jgi:Fe-S cluster assembly protein SufD
MNAFHIGTTQIQMNAASHYTSNVISLGGSLVRNNITAVLDAEGSECTLNGLTLSTGTQIIDNHTAIDHAKPHCNSHELYKAILDGGSKGVFNGKIFVRKDAQKTDAKQTNKTLLLSDDATINTKPQLEIFADDVKCTHGATIGQLDDEQLFYLRSRGIDLAAARDILTFAFAGDVINRITIEPLRQQVEKMIHERLDIRQTGIEEE